MEYLTPYEIANEYQMAISASPELPTEFREMLVTASDRAIYYYEDKTFVAYHPPVLSHYDSDAEVASAATEMTCPSTIGDDTASEGLYDEEQTELSEEYLEEYDNDFYEYYYEEDEDYYTLLRAPGAPKPSDAGRYRLPTCHWVLEQFPDIFDDEDEDDLPPMIKVTTPEGETFYPTDYKDYSVPIAPRQLLPQSTAPAFDEEEETEAEDVAAVTGAVGSQEPREETSAGEAEGVEYQYEEYEEEEEHEEEGYLNVPGGIVPVGAWGRLQTCQWTLEKFPDVFDDEEEEDLPPTIMVTTPQGEIWYPTDYTRYGWGV